MKRAAENCSFQGAYMRMFDLIDESSRLSGGKLPGDVEGDWLMFGPCLRTRTLRFEASIIQAFFEFGLVFFRKRHRFPTREALHLQTAELHQLAEHAAPVSL
jgi:hypothetical protein